MRLRPGTELVIASHNAGKIRELAALIAPLGLRTTSAGEHSLNAPAETGDQFSDNALIKARYAASATGLPALADDSGVEVDALGGAPGVYTARWAGPAGDFSQAIARVEQELNTQPNPDRRAAYVCALVLCWPDGAHKVCEARRAGFVVPLPRGTSGAGFEPVFLPHGFALTYGEMAPSLKHRVNARAGAMRSLLAALHRET